MTKKFRFLPLVAMMAVSALALNSCKDDDDDNGGDGTPARTDIVTLDKWIGSPCTCEGEGCTAVGAVAMPYPIDTDGDGTPDGTIKGCENIDTKNLPEGSVVACIQSIDPNLSATAPVTYFPQGYCAVAAVGCSGSTFCKMARFGDVGKMTSCPAGTVFIAAPFKYTLMNPPEASILDAICAKACNTDADCNQAGEMSCLNKNGHKFCYHEKNFEFLCNDYPNDCSNINYTDF